MSVTESDAAKTLPNHVYRPVFLSVTDAEASQQLQNLIQEKGARVHDTFLSQLKELIKISHPSKALTPGEYEEEIKAYTGEKDPKELGNWVYYPWSNTVCHLLGEIDFIKVRTSRNIYKITPVEIETLKTKKIGIIGLSVGQSIANTVALERICGELRLADFDDLELSNMNRLMSGVPDIGVPKVVLAARKIAELDPYISVKCFAEGIHAKNIDEFLNGDGKLDVLVEECDAVDMKILSRLKAREYAIPVVMDTNDRGLLDVERFDLEPGRPLFHGRLDESIDIERLGNLTNQEKVPLLGAMVDLTRISDKMKFSLGEMGKTIGTWPQLASSVMLGGAMVTDTCRRILLGEFQRSGRYYVDFDELIK